MQQKGNGQHLRSAYVGKGQCNQPQVSFKLESSPDSGLLFDIEQGESPHPSQVSLLSDDQQRCHVSGQVLMNSMLPTPSQQVNSELPLPVVPWHTHDFKDSYMWYVEHDTIHLNPFQNT